MRVIVITIIRPLQQYLLTTLLSTIIRLSIHPIPNILPKLFLKQLLTQLNFNFRQLSTLINILFLKQIYLLSTFLIWTHTLCLNFVKFLLNFTQIISKELVLLLEGKKTFFKFLFLELVCGWDLIWVLLKLLVLFGQGFLLLFKLELFLCKL